MKFGIRMPSIKKSLAARTSWKRYARHSLGLKAPRGMGMLTNPKRASYNWQYKRTTVGIQDLVKPTRQVAPRQQISVPQRVTQVSVGVAGKPALASVRVVAATSEKSAPRRKSSALTWTQFVILAILLLATVVLLIAFMVLSTFLIGGYI